MIEHIKKGFLSILGIFVLLLSVILIENYREASLRNRKYDSPTLTPRDKKHIREALILKNSLGDKVWPRLAESSIPIILFNDHYEFLVGDSLPPEQWHAVRKDRFSGSVYYRKELDNPQNFAVRVDDKWAGSIATFDRLNREYYLGVRNELPPFIAQLYPYQYASVSSDLYIVALLNEIFHAYQAKSFPDYFNQAQNSFQYERQYPFKKTDFSKLWDKEGYYLWKATNNNDADTVVFYTRKFLQNRDLRRQKAHLSPELVSYEQHIEWLEGLAKYSELAFYELSARHKPASSLVYFHSDLPHWKQQFATLKEKLGEQQNSYRFYLSGMAQAQILDKLSPQWKQDLSIQPRSLEDLLRKAVAQ